MPFHKYLVGERAKPVNVFLTPFSFKSSLNSRTGATTTNSVISLAILCVPTPARPASAT